MGVMAWLRLLKTGEPFPYSLPPLVTQPEAEDPVEGSEALGMADHTMEGGWGPE